MGKVSLSNDISSDISRMYHTIFQKDKQGIAIFRKFAEGKLARQVKQKIKLS